MSGPVQLTNIKARRLEISAVASTVSAHDIQASDAEITSMSGHIEYSGSVVSGGRYEFQAHSGKMRLGLTGGFDFEGQTFSGQIDADPASDSRPSRSASLPGSAEAQSLKGTVGGGGAFVEATTFSGNVRIGRTVPEATPKNAAGTDADKEREASEGREGADTFRTLTLFTSWESQSLRLRTSRPPDAPDSACRRG